MTSFDPSTRHQPCSDADAAITTRQSIRAFLPRQVPRETVTEILEVAARAHALDTIIHSHPVRNDQPSEAPLLAEHLMKEAISATQRPSRVIAP
jgi:nitroreductase